jgi:hypothetical protein
MCEGENVVVKLTLLQAQALPTIGHLHPEFTKVSHPFTHNSSLGRSAKFTISYIFG